MAFDFDDREKELKSKSGVIIPPKEPGKCKHDKSWNVKCMECNYDFLWAPTQAQTDAVELEFKAHREVAIVLINELNDYLIEKGVDRNIRKWIYEHMVRSTVMLKYVHERDFKTFDEIEPRNKRDGRQPKL